MHSPFRIRFLVLWLVILCASIRAAAAQIAFDSNWPHWRGPLATGEAPGADPPIEWSEEKNVRWKIALPGKGHSSPVIWGERIFLTTAVPVGDALEQPRFSLRPGAHDNNPLTQRHDFVVLCIDRKSGAILWQKTVSSEIPHEGGHTTGSQASASPVVDAEHVFAFFGSRGLYCLDHDGEVQWETDLGDMHSKHGHGEGSSPVLHGDTLVVNWDHEEQSFVVAFEKSTGRQLWKRERNEDTSWASPIVVTHQEKPQVIVSGTNRVRAYDLATGEVVWECGGLSDNVVASPVAADGVVYAGSSYEKRAMFAVRLEGARGDVSDTANVLWRRYDRTPYVPSPLLYEGALYFLAHYQGVLTRADLTTGEDAGGPFRLSGMVDIYSSPVAAAGRIYITDRRAGTVVLSQGESPEFLAFNELDDSFSASAAIVGRELFLRGARFLYCIAEEAH